MRSLIERKAWECVWLDHPDTTDPFIADLAIDRIFRVNARPYAVQWPIFALALLPWHRALGCDSSARWPECSPSSSQVARARLGASCSPFLHTPQLDLLLKIEGLYRLLAAASPQRRLSAFALWPLWACRKRDDPNEDEKASCLVTRFRWHETLPKWGGSAFGSNLGEPGGPRTTTTKPAIALKPNLQKRFLRDGSTQELISTIKMKADNNPMFRP